MKRLKLLAVAAITGVATVLTSCEKDVYDPVYVAELKSALPNFDMKDLTKASINYGPGCKGAAISIYVDNPLCTYTSNGVLMDSLAGDPILSTFLDENGSFNGKLELPNYCKKVYITSSNWAVPHLITADVTNGEINVQGIETDSYTTRAGGMKKVVADDKLTEVGPLNTTHGKVTSIVGMWNNYGQASDPNGLYSTGIYTSDLISSIQSVLWNSASKKPGNLDNTNKITSTDIVNTSIAKTYQDNNGQLVTVTNAELFFTFIAESGYYSSAVGYYYYPTDQVPSSPNQVEKFLIIPNASISGNHANSFGKDPGNDAPMHTNTKVQLLFRDSNGKLTSKFPPGYTIGYFLIADAYSNATNNTTTTTRVDGTKDPYKIQQNKLFGIGIGGYYYEKDGVKHSVTKFYKNAQPTSRETSSTNFSTSWKYFDITSSNTGGTNGINYDRQWIYSNAAWNSDGKDKFIALSDRKTGEVVYGAEDGGDKSYEDIIFTISCSPEGAIFNPERPEITQDGSTVSTSSTKTHGYYAFEDIWSSGGDYDMNDVIVEYTYMEDVKQVTNYKTITNTKTGQTTTEVTAQYAYIDKATINIMPRHCGATYKDGFALQLPETFSTFRSKIKSITVNGTPLNKDNGTYWRTLAPQNSNLDGTLIDISSCQPRFTYLFFDNIRAQQEGKGYSMVIQFEDSESGCIRKAQWEANRYSQLTDAKAALNENRLKYFYNPYIVVYNLSVTEGGQAGELEVHLPLYPFTLNGIPSAGQASITDHSWNLWFVSAETAGQTGNLAQGGPYYPFAMDIPYYEGFYPSREETKISVAYPRFLQWQMEGNSKSDWYKYRAPHKTQPFSLDYSKSIGNKSEERNAYD